MQLKLTFVRLYYFIPVIVLLPLLASAALLRPENTDRLFQQQTQQQQAQQEQFDAKAPDVRLSPAMVKTGLTFPMETLCYTIEHVAITGQESFPDWVPIKRLASQAVGHCIGVKGINLSDVP